MQMYLDTLSYDIWEVIVNGYIMPSMPTIDTIDKKLYESDYKAKNSIIYGLVDSGLVKVMGYKSAKEI